MPTDPLPLPYQATGHLCLCLAIKLSILQESLPTVFTAKWPKDTAVIKDWHLKSQPALFNQNSGGSGAGII
jgi:hypothetical protein